MPDNERNPRPLGDAENDVGINRNLDVGRLIELPKIEDRRGNLTFLEQNRHIPFDIKRLYYLYDVPGGEFRGGHAHKQLEQFVIAASGSFDLLLSDGVQTERIQLNRSYYGVYLPAGLWRELENFSSGSVCLVAASDYYDEDDYIRDFVKFREWSTGGTDDG